MIVYFLVTGDNKLTGEGEPIGLTDTPVSCSFFPLLGLQPIAGRQFTADECKWNGPKATLLSYGLWRDHYALDPGVIGRRLVGAGFLCRSTLRRGRRHGR